MTENEHSDFIGRSTPQGDELDSLLSEVVGALREPVEPRPGFDSRVMAAVRRSPSVHRAVANPWWKRRSITLSPVTAMALAASIAVLAYVGGRKGDAADDRPSAAAAAAPAEIVRFVFIDRGASHVSVVGSFNQWQKDATPLHATGVPGVWAVSVPLSAGMHEYAFVVDGERWTPDPFAPGMTDEFGTESSIVRVQGPTSS